MICADYNEYAQNAEPPRTIDYVIRSVMLCKDPEFWHHLERRQYYIWGAVSEKQARNILCELCGVQSRSELKDNTEAQQKFEALIKEFRRDQAQRAVA
jgi:hypothetical protein